MRNLRLTAVLVGVLVAGCSAAPGTTRTGELGNGTFNYKCLDASDAACPTLNADPQQFPEAVAVGGKFKLLYTPKSSTEDVGSPKLAPISFEYLSGSNEAFTALIPGTGGIVARASTDSSVVDYLPVKIKAVTAIKLIDLGNNVPAPQVQVDRGRQLTFTSHAMNGTTPLAGAIEYTWIISNPAVLALDQGNPTSKMSVTAKLGGKATITVKAGEITSDPIEVTVNP
ncbi:MAG: hypothetical protein JWM74_3553 [Myxococcaceae bacterium]|nr:hypothetical protein [Myxococcaceae bacterium]